MTPTTDDPIRADVERVLHAVVAVTLAVPLRIATAVPRCVRSRAQRLAPLVEPLRVVRSLVELVAASGRDLSAPTPGAMAERPAPAPSAASPSDPAFTADGPAPVSMHLPIDDYESLAASQVVDRLPTLTPAELAAVRQFETAHRGRRTVLGRIEQLLA